MDIERLPFMWVLCLLPAVVLSAPVTAENAIVVSYSGEIMPRWQLQAEPNPNCNKDATPAPKIASFRRSRVCYPLTCTNYYLFDTVGNCRYDVPSSEVSDVIVVRPNLRCNDNERIPSLSQKQCHRVMAITAVDATAVIVKDNSVSVTCFGVPWKRPPTRDCSEGPVILGPKDTFKIGLFTIEAGAILRHRTAVPSSPSKRVASSTTEMPPVETITEVTSTSPASTTMPPLTESDDSQSIRILQAQLDKLRNYTRTLLQWIVWLSAMVALQYIYTAAKIIEERINERFDLLHARRTTPKTLYSSADPSSKKEKKIVQPAEDAISSINKMCRKNQREAAGNPSISNSFVSIDLNSDNEEENILMNLLRPNTSAERPFTPDDVDQEDTPAYRPTLDNARKQKPHPWYKFFYKPKSRKYPETRL